MEFKQALAFLSGDNDLERIEYTRLLVEGNREYVICDETEIPGQKVRAFEPVDAGVLVFLVQRDGEEVDTSWTFFPWNRIVQFSGVVEHG